MFQNKYLNFNCEKNPKASFTKRNFCLNSTIHKTSKIQKNGAEVKNLKIK